MPDYLGAYNGKNIKNDYIYYNDRFKEALRDLTDLVITNPSIYIKIVGGYDSLCQMCPRNRKSQNYNKLEYYPICKAYDGLLEPSLWDIFIAEGLGIHNLIDKQPIIARELFEIINAHLKKAEDLFW